MEVHHHPDLHHKRKNFREYFLEFLMIFLAVTVGFIAGNFREYITDGQKEKQYVLSLYEDLQVDTAKITCLINYDDEKINVLSHAPLLELKNYYAFGIENPVLGTQALKPNYYPNKKKAYQGQEHNRDFNVDMY